VVAVGQYVQLASPALENCVAEQLLQVMSLVVVQAVASTEPAAHCAVQGEHGCRPVEFQVEEAAQGSAHEDVSAFQPKPLAQPQTDWPVRPKLTPFCAAVGHMLHGGATKPVAL